MVQNNDLTSKQLELKHRSIGRFAVIKQLQELQMTKAKVANDMTYRFGMFGMESSSLLSK